MNKLAGSINFGQLKTQGDIGTPTTIEEAGTRLATILSITVGILTFIAFIWFVFKFITGAIAIISSGGDKGKLASAKADLTYGLTGLLVVISAIFIAELVQLILGIDIVNVAQTIINIRTNI